MDVETSNYPRDPTYYFEDGSTVLLVGGVLFKIHLSFLVPDRKPKDYTYDTCIKYLLKDSDALVTRKGTSDADPILIPGINARQFRHFLLAILGRPGDSIYMSLLADAQHSDRHTQELFVRYLDIGTVADLLNMYKLQKWARSQLELLLGSGSWFSEYTWDEELLLQLDAAVWEEWFCNDVQAFLRLILTPPDPITSHHKTTTCLETCISLYKNPGVLAEGSTLFGWVFLYILSLGHRSPAWLDKLTRDDRLVLYAAQAELTNLSSRPDLSLDWLTLDEDFTSNLDCEGCFPRLEVTWNSIFGRVGQLNSVVPLEDIRRIMFLPACRQEFAQAVRSPSWSCRRGCSEQVLYICDMSLNRLCYQLSDIHKHFVEHS